MVPVKKLKIWIILTLWIKASSIRFRTSFHSSKYFSRWCFSRFSSKILREGAYRPFDRNRVKTYWLGDGLISSLIFLLWSWSINSFGIKTLKHNFTCRIRKFQNIWLKHILSRLIGINILYYLRSKRKNGQIIIKPRFIGGVFIN